MSAPLSGGAPTDDDIYADAAISGWGSSGFVSEDGLALSLSKSFEQIKEWGGGIVKRILNEFDGTIKYTHLELSEFSLRDSFGPDALTIEDATSAHGTRWKVKMGAEDLPAKQYLFRMKDGNTKIRLYVPNGIVTELEEISFVKTDAIKLGVTLGCQTDSSGAAVYLYTDDGVKSVVGS